MPAVIESANCKICLIRRQEKEGENLARKQILFLKYTQFVAFI